MSICPEGHSGECSRFGVRAKVGYEEFGFGHIEFEDLADHVERAGRQVGIYASGVRGEAQAGGVNVRTFKARS